MSPVVIVGAGIVGASVAYHLARRGLPVALIERVPAPAAGVTAASFAWIGDAGGEWPGGAKDLRGSVLLDYRRLEAEVPGGPCAGPARSPGATPRCGPGTVRARSAASIGLAAALEPHLRELP